MLFQGKDGELRIYEYGNQTGASTAYYAEVLFCEMNLSAPISRPRSTETLIMDRGVMDDQSHFIESDDTIRYGPIPLTFSCRLADTVDTRMLSDWLSGATNIPNTVGGTTQIYSFDGSGVSTSIDGNAVPAFKGSAKQTYLVEVLWDGTSDYGVKFMNTYFPPGEQTITESVDGLVLSANGQIYGDVTRMTSFDTHVSTSGTSKFS